MATIDRYLIRRMLGTYLAVIAVVVAIMALENTARLAADLEKTSAPFALLARLTWALVPEHLSVAIPVATFLATALAVRGLALRGEWQMLGALGLSPVRVMAAPMLAAALAGGVQLADRLAWRPAGERALDAVYHELASGRHGVALPGERPIELADGVTFYGHRLPNGSLSDVLITRGHDTFSAARATATGDGAGGVSVRLSDGVAVERVGGAPDKRLFFAHLLVPLRVPGLAFVPGSRRQQLDRLSVAGLLAASPANRADARAALAERVESALFCLVLPWLAVLLGIPPRRATGGPALMVGILLIALHLRTAGLVEDAASGAPVLASLLHLAAWMGAVAALGQLVRTQGEGVVDQVIGRGTAAVAGAARGLLRPSPARALWADWRARTRFALAGNPAADRRAPPFTAGRRIPALPARELLPQR